MVHILVDHPQPCQVATIGTDQCRHKPRVEVGKAIRNDIWELIGKTDFAAFAAFATLIVLIVFGVFGVFAGLAVLAAA